MKALDALIANPRARWWLLAAVLALLALASSANGIANGFTYDDVYVIQKNGTVHSLQGWWRLFGLSYWPRVLGGDGYRPVTMLAFAIEWAIGGGAPWVYHAVNVVLYCTITVVVFWLGSLLLPVSAAFIAAALFAVHPVHVEAVANIVGQSELSVALLLTLATAIYIRGRQQTGGGGSLSKRAMLGIGLCYAVAMFSKEHAIVLPALLVAAELLLVRDERPLWARLTAMRPFLLALTLIATLYLTARYAVKDGQISGFQPFVVFQALNLSYANRVLTMLGVVPEWVRLLLWPASLSTEYAPPDIDIAQGVSLLQLPGALMLVGVLGLGLLLWRRRGTGAVASFGITWMCITLLPSSNFVIPAGIILAERTLFLPSLGAMLALAAAWPWLRERAARLRSNDARRVTRLLLPVTFGAILVAGSWRSFTRTRVWHDNERIFWQAVYDAPHSYRAHYMLGAWMFETGRKKEGEQHYRRALALFPYDPFMAYNLAQQYQWSGMHKAAIPLYRWAFEILPTFRRGEGRLQLAICLLDVHEFTEAREQAFLGMQMGGASLRNLRRVVQLADSALGVNAPAARPKRPRRDVASFDGKLRGTMQFTAADAEVRRMAGFPSR